MFCICGAAVLCIVIWTGGAVLTYWLADISFTDVTCSANRRALFGDSFGAVNALISACAFACMIIALIFQRKELCLQRKELKAQREEFSQQNKTLALQRFENTFFNMMEVQQKIVNDLSAENADLNNYVTGRRLFRYAFKECEHHVKPKPNEEDIIMGLYSVMEKYGFSEYDQYYTSTYFDHYFRHFYRILKFVDQNKWLTFEEQYKYTSMLRGTLSRYELVWLFYNGLSDNGRDKLKPLMENYSMLKNLRTELLALCKENIDKFKETRVPKEHFTDYVFALSDEKGTDKYYIGAFYGNEELQDGIEYYEKWKSFFEKNKIPMEWKLNKTRI